MAASPNTGVPDSSSGYPERHAARPRTGTSRPNAGGPLFGAPLTASTNRNLSTCIAKTPRPDRATGTPSYSFLGAG